MEELLNEFKGLSISEKRKEIADELTDLSAVICKLNMDIEATEGARMPLNLKKLYDGLSSESEYLDSIYENIFVIKDILAIYLNEIVDQLYVNPDEVE